MICFLEMLEARSARRVKPRQKSWQPREIYYSGDLTPPELRKSASKLQPRLLCAERKGPKVKDPPKTRALPVTYPRTCESEIRQDGDRNGDTHGEAEKTKRESASRERTIYSGLLRCGQRFGSRVGSSARSYETAERYKSK